MKPHHALAALALSALLAACGGGSSGEPGTPMPNEVPDSATVSSAAYGQYADSLVKTETGQPADVNRVVPPSGETDLPLPVT